ncbi:unnamed protein product [Rotaria sordida]|uniref:Uncharacterized protein n=1 Tax=Rotaria sordida TaxID=392033 RepID=A0A814GDT9_9BILA|nr:unnamed protein product [Rotaria sordida]
MSDEDERQIHSNTGSLHEMNNRRLSAIKLKLQELTREKTKYDVEKLIQDADFLRNEIGHLTSAIADITKDIIAQTNTKKALNAKMQILRSNSRLRFTNLQIALHDKERYEKELEKPNKSDDYRKLAQQKIESIIQALPQLEIQDKYIQQLEQAENAQIAARNKREKLVENSNSKSRKQSEIKQLLIDSATRLPQLEADIEKLRLEREHILTLIGKKKQCRRSSTPQRKLIDSPVQLFASLERDTLEYEKQQYSEQLEKIRLLLKYFHEKMSEHNLTNNDTSCSTPSSELMSPLYQSLTLFEEQTILSSYMNEHDDENNLSIKTIEPTIAIAMKLPRNFIPLDIKSTITNEIIHSPYYRQNSIEYKKELPSDILNKYAGVTKKKQQQSIHGKKNKKNRKNFVMTHSSQMINLYNDIRTSMGDSDTLPSMPMYEYELLPTIKALQLMEQSVESYLYELSKYYQDHLSVQIAEEHSEIPEDDDIQDSALDTFSEGSSLVEATNLSKDLTSIIPISTNIPQARSSSSSDDKKTIVSSSSPSSSHHSNSKVENQSSLIAPLTTVEELPIHLSSLTMQIAQIERQISDEGYRSVRNETQQHTTINNNSPLLTRSHSYDCTEKVDKWLSSTTAPLLISTTNEIINLDDNTNFQAIYVDDEEENLVESTISVSDDWK